MYKALGVWIELTTLLIPGRNDDETELRELAGFIKSDLGEDVPWHISRFFPAYKMGGVPISPIETLRRAQRLGREAGLKHVYLGNVLQEEGEDTRCPTCDTVLVRRTGLMLLENRLANGACPNCWTPVAGVWQ